MKVCMVCAARFPEGTEHECPPDVRKRFHISMWTRHIQVTWNNRGKGYGKAAALKFARQTLPNITAAQVAVIGTGEIEWAEVCSWFGVTAEESEVTP